MKSYHVKRSKLEGAISLPASKSQTLRAILFASFAEGKSLIKNYLPSPDAYCMMEACRLFGAKIEIFENHLVIEGTKVDQTEDVIQCGNSGIVLRFMSGIGALSSKPVVITGDESIRHRRPMKPLIDGLQQLGVHVKSMRGDHFAPLIIEGPIRSSKASIEGQDSQFVSGLLIAAAIGRKPLKLTVTESGEKPWVMMTLQWLDRLGISYSNKNFEYYELGESTGYKGFEYEVPGDLSTAAFPIAAAITTGSSLTLHHVDLSDCQGDKEVIYLLQKMGAKIEIDHERKTLFVHSNTSLNGISVDINDYIDALPILSVLGCFATGETYLRNASIARHKECNRITCIVSELKKMGAKIKELNDGVLIQESSLYGSTQLNSFHDHRMVMSLVCAALGAQGESRIAPVECVSKTYPTFVEDFQKIGSLIE